MCSRLLRAPRLPAVAVVTGHSTPTSSQERSFRMRRLLVPLVAVPLLAAAATATAWGAPPGPAKPIDGSVQFGFAPGNPAVPPGAPPGAAAAIEDKIYPAVGVPQAMTELTPPLAIRAGGTGPCNVDGPPQPLVYRLHNGETVDKAIATLQARADETIPNPNPVGTPAMVSRRR